MGTMQYCANDSTTLHFFLYSVKRCGEDLFSICMASNVQHTASILYKVEPLCISGTKAPLPFSSKKVKMEVIFEVSTVKQKTWKVLYKSWCSEVTFFACIEQWYDLISVFKSVPVRIISYSTIYCTRIQVPFQVCIGQSTVLSSKDWFK